MIINDLHESPSKSAPYGTTIEGLILMALPLVSLTLKPMRLSLCSEGARFMTTGRSLTACCSASNAAGTRYLTIFMASTGV